jgi:hypothetical protein
MRAFASATQTAAAQIDASQMGRMIVMPPPQQNPMFDFADFASELKKFPGKFGFLGGGGILNPMIQAGGATGSDARRQFADQAKRIADAGALGFGEIALLHLSMAPNHPFEQVSPDHPLMVQLVEIAGSRNLVIELHMDCVPGEGDVKTPAGFQVPPNPPMLTGNIPAFERLLAHERKARIIWAHGGSDYTGNMTATLVAKLMDAHPNLYMSLRVVPPEAPGEAGLSIKNKVLVQGGIDGGWLSLFKAHPDRFVLGSDSFFVPAQIPPQAPGALFARGNQSKLMAAASLLNALPSDLAKRIGMENPSKLYGA